MKRAESNFAATREEARSTCELLLLPDGRILAHNITPALARLLADLDPASEAMRDRAALSVRSAGEASPPPKG
jgi:hypothetical protein